MPSPLSRCPAIQTGEPIRSLIKGQTSEIPSLETTEAVYLSQSYVSVGNVLSNSPRAAWSRRLEVGIPWRMGLPKRGILLTLTFVLYYGIQILHYDAHAHGISSLGACCDGKQATRAALPQQRLFRGCGEVSDGEPDGDCLPTLQEKQETKCRVLAVTQSVGE